MTTNIVRRGRLTIIGLALGIVIGITNLARSATTYGGIAYGNGSFVAILAMAMETLGEGLDATSLEWTTGGGDPWIPQAAVTHDGTDAARSGTIADLQESWLETTVTGPGTLAFWWMVSSEMDYDVLEFSIDGLPQRRISGDEIWQQIHFDIPGGTHTLRWSYTKDDSTAKGHDAGYVDEVTFVPHSGPPVVLAQPPSQRVGLGDTVTLSAGVGGATPRVHQWFNDTGAISGATNASLTLSNIALADAGDYFMAVTNDSGSAASSNALLTVTLQSPVQLTLLYSDQPSTSPYGRVLNILGLAHQVFSNFVAFNYAVSNANPETTLVIVDAFTVNAPFNAVGRFANSGGRAIFQAWTLAVGNSVAAAFQANVVEPLLSSPQPVHDWGGTPLFESIASPLDLTDRHTFSGQTLQEAEGGRAVAGYSSTPMAGQAAIVIGHSGRTVLNGFLLEEVSSPINAMTLARNEIAYVLDEELPIVAPPVVVNAATNLTVVQGANAVLSLECTGTLPMSYTWRRRLTSVKFETLNSHTSFHVVTNVQPNTIAATNAYYVVLTNAVDVTGLVRSQNIFLRVLADTDGDGAPDEWEDDNNLDRNDETDGAEDADMDDMSNFEEYIAGTDPNKEDSYLKVDEISAVEGIAVRFNAVSNRTYTVEYKNSLDLLTWTKLADVAASRDNRVVSVKDPAGTASRFYRLRTPKL